MKQLQEILDSMEPGAVLAALAPALKKILSHLDEEARVRFVVDIIGEPGADKLSSIVNL